MASGVVDQIKITPANAAGTDIVFTFLSTQMKKAAVLSGCGLVKNGVIKVLARFLQAAATTHKPQVLGCASHNDAFRIDGLKVHAWEFALACLGVSTGFHPILSA